VEEYVSGPVIIPAQLPNGLTGCAETGSVDAAGAVSTLAAAVVHSQGVHP
jgi:hypothetical protein